MSEKFIAFMYIHTYICISDGNRGKLDRLQTNYFYYTYFLWNLSLHFLGSRNIVRLIPTNGRDIQIYNTSDTEITL